MDRDGAASRSGANIETFSAIGDLRLEHSKPVRVLDDWLRELNREQIQFFVSYLADIGREISGNIDKAAAILADLKIGGVDYAVWRKGSCRARLDDRPGGRLM